MKVTDCVTEKYTRNSIKTVEMQSGSASGYGTNDAIFIMQCTLSKYLAKNKNLI